jgi:hypothetical protein
MLGQSSNLLRREIYFNLQSQESNKTWRPRPNSAPPVKDNLGDSSSKLNFFKRPSSAIEGRHRGNRIAMAGLSSEPGYSNKEAGSYQLNSCTEQQSALKSTNIGRIPEDDSENLVSVDDESRRDESFARLETLTIKQLSRKTSSLTNFRNSDDCTRAFWLEKLLIDSASGSENSTGLSTHERTNAPELVTQKKDLTTQVFNALEGLEQRIRRFFDLR